VTWILAAIQALQENGLAEVFDVNQLITRPLEHVDNWLRNPAPNNFYNCTNRAD
jgi:hypothetical protein